MTISFWNLAVFCQKTLNSICQKLVTVDKTGYSTEGFNYSKWLLDAILNILDLASLADLDKFTQTVELIMVFECIWQF